MNYKDIVIPILKTAGEELMKHYGSAKTIAQKSNFQGDVVTKQDKKTEKYLESELKKAFPDIGFYGEEYGGSKNGTFWLVDPIDGTALYIRGMPACSIMITLIHNNNVVFSAINNFPLGNMYVAEKDGGATRNGKPIHVSDRKLKDAYLFVEINRFKSEDNQRIYDRLRGKAPIINTMTAGYEFCMVAEGGFEGRIQVDPFGGLYDFPVGSLLIQEAGGVVANIGKPAGVYDYRNLSFLATNPTVFKELTEEKDAIFPIT